jgi:hypothetical protein
MPHLESGQPAHRRLRGRDTADDWRRLVDTSENSHRSIFGSSQTERPHIRQDRRYRFGGLNQRAGRQTSQRGDTACRSRMALGSRCDLRGASPSQMKIFGPSHNSASSRSPRTRCQSQIGQAPRVSTVDFYFHSRIPPESVSRRACARQNRTRGACLGHLHDRFVDQDRKSEAASAEQERCGIALSCFRARQSDAQAGSKDPSRRCRLQWS